MSGDFRRSCRTGSDRSPYQLGPERGRGWSLEAIYIENPGIVTVREIERPQVEEGQALLKVLCGGICGSDLSTYRGKFSYGAYPRIPGHEIAARVEQIGPNESGLEVGSVVTCYPYFSCGHCHSCQSGLVNACMDNRTMGVQRDGGFCEYLSMPVSHLVDGTGIDPETLVLVEPFSIAYHAVSRAKVGPTDKVLVVGAGTIGVFAAIVAKSFGAEVCLCDVDGEKLDYVSRFGADHLLLNQGTAHFRQEVSRLAGDGLFDVTIEAVGLPSTFQDCIDATAFGGRMVQVGVGNRRADFDFTELQRKELNVFGSRNALPADFHAVLDLIRGGAVDLSGMVTDVYPFAEAAKAFADLDANRKTKLKVLLSFNKERYDEENQ